MKRLTLIRHAKADMPFDCSDFERPLSAAGEADIQRVATRFQPQVPPDRIITSKARRAMRTAVLFMGSCDYPEELLCPDDSLYSAGSYDLLRLLSEQPDQHDHLILIGHNPTFSELATQLCNQLVNFSPATVTHLELNIDRWIEICNDSAQLVERLTPND